MPIGAFSIDTDKDRKIQRRKTLAFITLDILLMSALIVTFIMLEAKHKTVRCDMFVIPPTLVLFALVFFSFVVDWLMWRQIKKDYVGRNLAFTSIILDLLIFGVGIWEVFVAAHLHQNCENMTFWTKLGVSTLVVFTFMRVYYILLIILYPIFVMPCYYMPDCCICKKWLEGAAFDQGVW